MNNDSMKSSRKTDVMTIRMSITTKKMLSSFEGRTPSSVAALILETVLNVHGDRDLVHLLENLRRGRPGAAQDRAFSDARTRGETRGLRLIGGADFVADRGVGDEQTRA